MLKINPNILQTPITDGKILLLEPQQGLYFELNDVAVVIFQGILQGLSEAEIVTQITQSFAVSEPVAQTDMLALLQQLQDNHIITT